MNQQKELFQGYPFPRTNVQEVLLTLILQKYVSYKDFSYMQGFRTRVSEINNKYGIRLDTVNSKEYNRFGNIMNFHIHKLPEDQKQKAIEVYLKINKQ